VRMVMPTSWIEPIEPSISAMIEAVCVFDAA
jgi:hypothetical protein